MRLFVAINFNNETRSALLALRDDLRSKSIRGNFSTPENIHLTLVFLGECDRKETAAAKAALDEIAFQPFIIKIDRIGLFRRGGGSIWWAGARKSEQLIDLQRALTNRLISSGFALDTRKYSPHITLGREVITDERERTLEPFGETVKAIDLMSSERIRGKLTYTAIYSKGAIQL